MCRSAQEAWGAMSDFQMFAVAADDRQIKGLYESGGAQKPMQFAVSYKPLEPRQGEPRQPDKDYLGILEAFGPY